MTCLRAGCSYSYSAALGSIDCNSDAQPLVLCRAQVPSSSSSSSGRLGDRRSVTDGGGGGDDDGGGGGGAGGRRRGSGGAVAAAACGWRASAARSLFCLSQKRAARARNAKYGPYSQTRNYLGLYSAVFTVKKAKYTPPNPHLAAVFGVFRVPGAGGKESQSRQ